MDAVVRKKVVAFIMPFFPPFSSFLGPDHTKQKKHKIFRNSIFELLELEFVVRERSPLTLQQLLNNSDQMTQRSETM